MPTASDLEEIHGHNHVALTAVGFGGERELSPLYTAVAVTDLDDLSPEVRPGSAWTDDHKSRHEYHNGW